MFYSLTLHRIYLTVKNLMGEKKSMPLESKSARCLSRRGSLSSDAFGEFGRVFSVTKHKNAHTSSGWDKHTTQGFKLLSGASK